MPALHFANAIFRTFAKTDGMMRFSVAGNLVDVHQKKIYPAEIMVEGERIVSITPTYQPLHHPGNYILPGFIDAHIHIESSMLVPSEFARLAVVHGTVATVSDPHEIANVCGVAGIEFMIEDGKSVPFKFNFGAPSCVPATPFETAGATVESNEVEALLQREDVLYLSEMMNFPGVLHGDSEVLKKIAAAKRWNKPVDGHAPGLRGAEAAQYIAAGISTDHECCTAGEALDKLRQGMKILIREGSAAKNFEALIDLLHHYPERMMFCSDDKHPDSLVEGHINQLCARAVAKGIDVFKVLQAACVTPVRHYGLKVGLLRANDFADFIVVKDLVNFEVLQTYVGGALVAENGKSLIGKKPSSAGKPINNFNCSEKVPEDFAVPFNGQTSIAVIEALDGQLITNKQAVPPNVEGGFLVSDTDADVLKIVVVNRYTDAPIAKGFIKSFGLKSGAIASSVAHDSHNIVAVGVDDESICRAVKLIIEERGGVSWATAPLSALAERLAEAQPLLVNATAVESTSLNSKAQAPSEGEGWGEAVATLTNNASKNTNPLQSGPLSNGSFPPSGEGRDGGPGPQSEAAATPSAKADRGGVLPLPVAGLMSADDGYLVAEKYAAMDKAAKALGSTLLAPFMTLSFMALLVIPHLKLSDKGLFDGDAFTLV